jgi:hypothetical protein
VTERGHAVEGSLFALHGHPAMMVVMALVLFRSWRWASRGDGIAVMPLVDDEADLKRRPRDASATQEAAPHRGADHERDADGEQPGDGDAHSR